MAKKMAAAKTGRGARLSQTVSESLHLHRWWAAGTGWPAGADQDPGVGLPEGAGVERLAVGRQAVDRQSSACGRGS